MHPPRAPREPVVRELHGHRRVDDFAWMADREDPRLLAYLQAENSYADARTRSLEPLAEALVAEIKARTVETDLSVPVRHDRWWYYARTVAGQEYAVHARVPLARSPQRPQLDGDGPPAGEQVLLDENAEAAESDFFALGGLQTSADGGRLAWSVDRMGEERYDLFVRDLDSGVLLDEGVRGIGEGLALSLDGRQVFYSRVDEAWRPHQIWRHEIGADPQHDVLVLDEPDERFFVGVDATRDDRWVVLSSSSKTTSQVWLVDGAAPLGEPVSVVDRRQGVLVDAEPCGSGILLVHNGSRANFEVAWLPRAGAPRAEWVSLPWSTPDEFVTGLEVFDRFVALSVRVDGQASVRVVPRLVEGAAGRPGDGAPAFGMPREPAFPGELRTVSLGSTPDPASMTLQVLHESLATPPSVYDYDVESGTLTLLKRKQVPAYDLGELRETRTWAQAPDGVRVPISLVHRADVSPDGTAAGLLYGYGAYGMSSDPWFSVPRLSLLDRGLVFAVAHVRGGTELGWDWYEQGRLTAKGNSFTDFVACGRHLVETGWVAADLLAAEGASAGGWLVAAAAAQAPGLFRVVAAEVPFVDPVTTMLDPALPLTVTEQEEWGDPIADPAAYERLVAWSPYEQAATGPALPALVVTASVHDTRVLVTEPAKWVARLRERPDADEVCRPVLFRTQLRAGHAGVSGRYQLWAEIAWEWAALLGQLGRGDPGGEGEASGID